MVIPRVLQFASSFKFQIQKLISNVKVPTTSSTFGQFSNGSSSFRREHSFSSVCFPSSQLPCHSLFESVSRLTIPTQLPSRGLHSSCVVASRWLKNLGYTDQEFEELKMMHRIHYAKPKPVHKKRKLLDGNPQMKGVVLKTLIKKPKKPNSANRKCVLVRLTNGKEAVAHVPGEGHNLQEHNIVLVRNGRVRDVPGLKLKVIRGKYDCAHVIKRKSS